MPRGSWIGEFTRPLKGEEEMRRLSQSFCRDPIDLCSIQGLTLVTRPASQPSSAIAMLLHSSGSRAQLSVALSIQKHHEAEVGSHSVISSSPSRSGANVSLCASHSLSNSSTYRRCTSFRYSGSTAPSFPPCCTTLIGRPTTTFTARR